MRRAIWLWNEETCAEALGENELSGEVPKCTGKQRLGGCEALETCSQAGDGRREVRRR